MPFDSKGMIYPNNRFSGGGMTLDVLSTNANFEVQRQNHFEVSITFIPQYDIGDGTVGTDPTFNQEFRISVQSIDIPDWSVDPVDIEIGNQTVHVAGRPSLGGNISIVLNDFIGLDLENRLYNWFRLVYDPETGLMGLAYKYKTEMNLYMYAPDGSCQRAWRCTGVFPTGISGGGSFDYGSGDKRQLTMELSVDFIYPIKRVNEHMFDANNIPVR